MKKKGSMYYAQNKKQKIKTVSPRAILDVRLGR